ncbi:hypothetical protein [Sphingobium sp. CFD-2]|nr:hypothetical protein [Sphingobium sp. CFD-2]
MSRGRFSNLEMQVGAQWLQGRIIDVVSDNEAERDRRHAAVESRC